MKTLVEIWKKNQPEIDRIETKIECAPGSIFDGILVDFGSQVGVGNRPKIDSKRHENMQAKKESKKQRTGGVLSRLGRVFARNRWGLGGGLKDAIPSADSI